MAFWKNRGKTSGPEVVVGKQEGVIPCEDPKKAVTINPDPPPDLTTKPKDIVGYCFGYVCPKKHVNSTFENITVDGYKERRVCQTCGAVAKPAVVRRFAEAYWKDNQDPYIQIYSGRSTPNWEWVQWFHGDCLWSHYEFVYYLEAPRRRKK